MSQVLKIGILWASYFKRSFLGRLPSLNNAYRPPSLFASRMRDAGHELQFLFCDDMLEICDLDGTSRKLQDDVDLLYIMTHGEFLSGGYEASLHVSNWVPATTGIGDQKLQVIVFDTCELLNTASITNWQAVWRSAKLGEHVRLLLGFDGPVAIDAASALRGKAFADNLIKGDTFADAWIGAARSTIGSVHKKAVAIGIGDNQTDAQAVLDNASLASLPGPRGTGTPDFWLRT